MHIATHAANHTAKHPSTRPALLAILALAALASPAVRADPAPPPAEPPAAAGPPGAAPAKAPPQGIPTFPMLRVVPKGEVRTIAFFTSLNPDCSVIGPVVVRILAKPAHGRLTPETAESFPRYGPGATLTACNARKVQGQRLLYEPDEDFEGTDPFRILVINADGTGYEIDGTVSVR